jgi:glycosyltransferase involved in cell wall biosynthesis
VAPALKLSGLSVVVPAFNEEGSLERVVRAVDAVAADIADEHEIVIIDDGSRDATPAIADRLADEIPNVRVIRHPLNLGFGAAQKSGFGHARHEFVTLVPSDGQFDVQDLRLYVPLMKDADIVVGCRVRRKDRWRRRLNTRIFRSVMRILFGVDIRDINWVKLFRRSVLEGIDIEFKGIGVDAEVVVKARQKGCRFAQVKVSYLPRTTGKSTGDKLLNVIITVLELLVLFYRVRIRGEKT